MAVIPYNQVDELAGPVAEILLPTYNQVICRLRRRFPWLYHPANTIAATSGLIFPSVQRYWDSLCDPLPTDQPFIRGGQCPGEPYRTDAIIYEQDGTEIDGSISPPLVGPIVDAGFFEERENGFFNVKAFIRNEQGQYAEAAVFTSRQDPDEELSAYFFVRYLGQGADDCGNQEPWPVPEVPPQFPITIPIDFGDGQGRPINVNLPGFDPTGWPDFTFEPTFEFDGIPITFTPEGIEFPDDLIPDWPMPTPPDVNVPPGGDTQTQIEAAIDASTTQIINQIASIPPCPDVDLQPVLDKIDECCCTPEVEIERYPIAGATQGGVFPLEEKTFAVVVRVVAPFTPATPTQAGSGTAPDVFHWGWLSVGYETAIPGTRIPLQFSEQCIPVLDRGATIAVSAHYQNACTIEGIRVKELEP